MLICLVPLFAEVEKHLMFLCSGKVGGDESVQLVEQDGQIAGRGHDLTIQIDIEHIILTFSAH